MADEAERKTLQDLFRVVNDMRGEMNMRFDEAAAERQECAGPLTSKKVKLKPYAR